MDANGVDANLVFIYAIIFVWNSTASNKGNSFCAPFFASNNIEEFWL